MIIKTGIHLEEQGVGFKKSFKKELGNGKDTLFWLDVWYEDIPFKDRFKRLFRLESDPNASVHKRLGWDGISNLGSWEWVNHPRGRTGSEFDELRQIIRGMVNNNEKKDRWVWALTSNGNFSTKVLANLVRSKIINSRASGFETMRNNLVPKKVEVFVWRAMNGRLPVLSELDKRGVDLHSVRCPICDNDIETVQHALFKCNISNEVWKRISKWFDLSHGFLDQNNCFKGLSSFQMTEVGFKIWQAVEWTCGYIIWKNRNKKVFKNICWNPPMALNEIQTKSYEWIAKRCKLISIEWNTWLVNPKRLIC
ncbi:uncharacterized protein [Rutidosis leptorrhynchoides]|uniref:uncharacterized protein n=1 Tax=Rutidosis leptorrhynchoides TaxID=125765 RepID=UPI003A992D62